MITKCVVRFQQYGLIYDTEYFRKTKKYYSHKSGWFLMLVALYTKLKETGTYSAENFVLF
jgi:hypothetical protein